MAAPPEQSRARRGALALTDIAGNVAATALVGHRVGEDAPDSSTRSTPADRPPASTTV